MTSSDTPGSSGSSGSLADAFNSANDGVERGLQQALARVESRMFGEGDPGVQLSRYHVLERIGWGGVGVVNAAYDPELHRRVAIKFLRQDPTHDDSRARLRLMREAQAMARLSHPNVAAVYDVGTFEEDQVASLVPGTRGVFVVMELLEGRTLRAELRATEPGWRVVAGLFRQAALGLHAAHEAGMVHRDFKPSNAIVTEKGRVAVIDFGLARASGEQPDTASSSGSAPLETVSDLETPLTKQGTVLGTPRYMAPEQHQGNPVDHRTDQYAFCAALYEAVYGKPPFDAPSMDALLRAKLGGLAPTPPAAKAPRWLYRLIRRGLAPDPTDRYPSVDALVAELDRGTSRRRRLAMGGTFLGAAALGAVSLGVWSAAQDRRCDGGEARLEGVWDGSVEEQVATAFTDAGVPYGADALAGVIAGLDAYRERWLAGHREACEATAVRGEQSPEAMDLRMACLARARTTLAATTAVLTSADASVIRKSRRLVSGLEDLGRCDDPTTHTRGVTAPDPDQQAGVDQAETWLAEAKTLSSVGRFEEAKTVLDRAEARAADLGYAPLETEVALAQAIHLEHTGDYDAAEAALSQAIERGTRFRQWDEVSHATINMMGLLGIRKAQPDKARAYEALAMGLAQQVGTPRALARVHQMRAGVRNTEGKYDDAATEYRRALELRQGADADPEALAVLRNNLAGVFTRQGKYAEAKTEFRAILELRIETLGPHHPLVAATRTNVGTVLSSLGEHDEAVAQHRQSVETLESVVGPEHPSTQNATEAFALALMRNDALEEAATRFRSVLAHREATTPDHPSTARCRFNLATVLWKSKEYGEAETLIRAAVQGVTKSQGAAHPMKLTMQSFLIDVLVEQEKFDAALQEAEAAWTAGENAAQGGWPKASVGFSLADLLVRTGGDATRARGLAQELVASLEKSDDDPEMLEEIRAWLGIHSGGS